MSIRKILILYAPCGAGHKKAAESLTEYFSRQDQITVEMKDILAFAPSWYRYIYLDGYYLLIKKYPKLWSLLYQGTELGYKEHILTRIVRKIEDSFFSSFYRYLELAKPTLLITTHFLPISLLKDKKRVFKFGAVVTDYYPHSLWVSNQIDEYFVASEYVKQVLNQKGINEENISITGIPVKPVTAPGSDKEESQKNIHQSVDLFTVLVLSGAAGIGDLSSIIRSLENFAGKIQVIVSTGMNKGLQADLEKQAATASLKIKVIGFTDKIYEYYALSDVVITKPGGLTVTECLTFGLPLLMINAIPGQEEENAKYVAGNKAGIIVEDIKQIPEIIAGWLKEPAQLATLRQQALLIAPRDSAEKIFHKLINSKT